MKKYIVYNSGGEILRTGICPDSMMHLQGENVMEGEANDIENKVVDGKIIRKSEEEIALIRGKMNPQPNPREKLVHQKEQEILRRMAIDELKQEDKI